MVASGRRRGTRRPALSCDSLGPRSSAWLGARSGRAPPRSAGLRGPHSGLAPPRYSASLGAAGAGESAAVRSARWRRVRWSARPPNGSLQLTSERASRSCRPRTSRSSRSVVRPYRLAAELQGVRRAHGWCERQAARCSAAVARAPRVLAWPHSALAPSCSSAQVGAAGAGESWAVRSARWRRARSVRGRLTGRCS